MVLWGGTTAHQLAEKGGCGSDGAGSSGMGQPEDGGAGELVKGKGEGGKREESQRRWDGTGGQEGVLGNCIQSPGFHQLLSGGGSLCTLFFFILSRYSCCDTASTDARISSSSQSFRPKAEGDIC